MARKEWAYIIDGIVDNHGSAQEFHRALVDQGSVVVAKSGQISDDVFRELFEYMGAASLEDNYHDSHGRQIVYLPIDLEPTDIIQLAHKNGLPRFNAQIAKIAARFPAWANRDSNDALYREKVLHEAHSQTKEDAIRTSLDFSLRFSQTDYASIIMRKVLSRFCNPPSSAELHNTPSIVPVFNLNGRLHDGFEDVLREYDPNMKISHDDKTTVLLCRSIVNLVHHLQRVRSNLPPTRYILAGDLRPYQILVEHNFHTVDSWMGEGPNDELVYVYNSTNTITI